MSYRTVVVKKRCKLEYSMNYLVHRDSEKETKINLDEINTIIIQSTQVSITSALLSELMEKKIKVIFCDKKGNPQSELIPYYAAYNVKEKIETQMKWKDHTKGLVWRAIVIQKIRQQSLNLKYRERYDTFSKLRGYCDEVEIADTSNREGHAAKVYFNSLFGNDFSRDKDCQINAYLDYGYSIILSAINREVKALGYLTELGIHHIGNTNPFNLSCDFMEPLRPLVDYLVISGKVNPDNYKSAMIHMLELQVDNSGKKMFLDNAIKSYVLSLFNALINDDPERIKFIDYERV